MKYNDKNCIIKFGDRTANFKTRWVTKMLGMPPQNYGGMFGLSLKYPSFLYELQSYQIFEFIFVIDCKAEKKNAGLFILGTDLPLPSHYCSEPEFTIA